MPKRLVDLSLAESDSEDTDFKTPIRNGRYLRIFMSSPGDPIIFVYRQPNCVRLKCTIE